MLKGQQVTSKYSLSFLVQERTCQQMGRQVNRQAGYTARLQGRHIVCNVCETVLSNHKINNTTTNSNICWIGISLLREVVSNFQESGDRSKNVTFFLFAPNDPLVNCFQKQYSKVPASFYFGKKFESSKSAKTYLICVISIGLSVHFHNARTRQRKIILDSFFYKLFFIPWNSFPTIFNLQLNFLSFVTTCVKYTIFCIPFVR